jgi:hypothetical protein
MKTCVDIKSAINFLNIFYNYLFLGFVDVCFSSFFVVPMVDVDGVLGWETCVHR